MSGHFACQCQCRLILRSLDFRLSQLRLWMSTKSESTTPKNTIGSFTTYPALPSPSKYAYGPLDQEDDEETKNERRHGR